MNQKGGLFYVPSHPLYNVVLTDVSDEEQKKKIRKSKLAPPQFPRGNTHQQYSEIPMPNSWVPPNQQTKNKKETTTRNTPASTSDINTQLSRAQSRNNNNGNDDDSDNDDNNTQKQFNEQAQRLLVEKCQHLEKLNQQLEEQYQQLKKNYQEQQHELNILINAENKIQPQQQHHHQQPPYQQQNQFFNSQQELNKLEQHVGNVLKHRQHQNKNTNDILQHHQ